MPAEDALPYGIPSWVAASSPASPTDAAERLVALDKFLVHRIGQVTQLDERLTQRLDQIHKAETTLRTVLDSLRVQTTSALTVVDQLRHFKESARATVADTLEGARAQLSQAAAMVRDGTGTLQSAQSEFAQSVAEMRRTAHDAVEPIRQDLARAVHEARVQADAITEILPGRVDEQVKQLENQLSFSINAASQVVQRRVEEFEGKSLIFEEWLEEQTRTAVGRVNDTAREHLSRLDETWDARVTEKFAEHERRANQSLAFVEQRTANLVSGAERDWTEKASGIREQIKQEIGAAEVQTEQAITETRRKLDFFQQKAADLTNHLENLIQRDMAQAQTLANNVGEAVRRDLEARARQTDQRLSVAMESAETSIRTGVTQLEQLAAEKARDLQTELSRAADSIARQSDAQLGQVRVALQRQAESVAAQFHQDLTPLLRQIDAHAADVKQSIRQRITELHDAGDAIAESAEARLASRLKDLRPATNEALDAAEKHLRDRVAQMTGAAHAQVETQEGQLANRLDALRPRAAATLKSIEADLIARIAKLEEDARTMTSHLERRLSQRIEEWVTRARTTLRATTVEVESAASPSGVPSPLKPTVEVFLDATHRPARVA